MLSGFELYSRWVPLEAVLYFVQSDFLGELLTAKCVDLSLLIDTVRISRTFSPVAA